MFKHIKHKLMSKSRFFKFNHFLETTKPNQNSTILDVGVADIEYSPIDNYLEKNYSYQENITALSIYGLTEFKKNYPKISTATFTGGIFPFDNNTFSIAYSNAVLEHVGGWDKQILFIKEINRVAKKFYLTTPAKEFPIELHTNLPLVHWLPKYYFDNALSLFGKDWAKGDYLNLLSLKDIKKLLYESEIHNFSIYIQRFMSIPLHYTIFNV